MLDYSMLVLLILVFPMHRASGNEASTGTLTSVCHLTSSYQVPSKDNGSYVLLGMAGLIIYHHDGGLSQKIR